MKIISDDLIKAIFIQTCLLSTWTISNVLRLYSSDFPFYRGFVVVFGFTITFLNSSAILMMFFYEGKWITINQCHDLDFFWIDFFLCFLLVFSLLLNKSLFIVGPRLCPGTCSLIEWLLLSMGCSILFLILNVHWWSRFTVSSETQEKNKPNVVSLMFTIVCVLSRLWEYHLSTDHGEWLCSCFRGKNTEIFCSMVNTKLVLSRYCYSVYSFRFYKSFHGRIKSNQQINSMCQLVSFLSVSFFHKLIVSSMKIHSFGFWTVFSKKLIECVSENFISHHSNSADERFSHFVYTIDLFIVGLVDYISDIRFRYLYSSSIYKSRENKSSENYCAKVFSLSCRYCIHKWCFYWSTIAYHVLSSIHCFVIITWSKHFVNDRIFMLTFVYAFQCMKTKQVFPLGNLIKDAWKIYQNDKDVGPVMMSHLFLILGLSYPVWIADNCKNSIDFLSSVHRHRNVSFLI